MKFSIIYKNNLEIRNNIISVLGEILKTHDLGKSAIRHPLFQTLPRWPNTQELASIPLECQCEHFEIANGKLKSIKLLVIDIESYNSNQSQALIVIKDK